MTRPLSLTLAFVSLLALSLPASARGTARSSGGDAPYRDALRSYLAGDFARVVTTLTERAADAAAVRERVLLARAHLQLGQCEPLRRVLQGIDLKRLVPEQRRLAGEFIAAAQRRCAPTAPARGGRP